MMTSRIDFVEHLGIYTGADLGGRTWRISRVFAGWKLEFRDSGDLEATYAGVHANLQAAQNEANR
ncbi:MAG: hypothetical protein ACXWDI_05765 [Nocardioides sp.]